MHRVTMSQMHGTTGARVVPDHGHLLANPGAEEDLGDPEEADRMQLLLSIFCTKRYKYMQYSIK